MSCLALLAAETSQDSLTRPNVLRWWHLIRYRGEHRELIRMVPEKRSELPETDRRSQVPHDAEQDAFQRHKHGHWIALSSPSHLICYQVPQLAVDLERVPKFG